MSDKTYLIETNKGKSYKITVPEDYKVTFGPVNPGTRGESKMALRVYENKEKQRAVFVDVVSFRDLSIPVEEKVRTAQRKTATLQGNGQAKDFVVEEWVNPDQPKKPGPLALPSLSGDTDDDDEGGF